MYMEWAAESFRENMNLEHHESLKILLFVLKSLSGIAFVFVLGFLAAGGRIDNMVLFILILAAVLDLIPEYLSIRAMGWLNDAARKAEQVQLVLAALAYMILATVLYVDPFQPFYGYAAFTIVWILSFLVQQAAFFLWNNEAA